MDNKKFVKKEDELRKNKEIRASQIRLIDENGENIGVISLSQALSMADNAGLDLVEISPNLEPPVCKIMDYGRFKFEKQKKKQEAKKNQVITKLKELTFGPSIEGEGYEVKLKAAQKFLEHGDKVKLTVRFKGRDLQFKQKGYDLLQKFKADLQGNFKIEKEPLMEGKKLSMIISQ